MLGETEQGLRKCKLINLLYAGRLRRSSAGAFGFGDPNARLGPHPGEEHRLHLDWLINENGITVSESGYQQKSQELNL